MNEPTLAQHVTTEGLDRAVLVGTGGLFDGRPGRDAPAPVPRVAGLPPILRSTIRLQRAGVKELIVLADDGDDRLKTLLRGDPRVKMVVRWMPMREFPPEDPRTWETLGNEITGSCLVVGGGTIFSGELVEQLREEARRGQPALLVSASGDAADPAIDLVVLPGGALRQAGSAAPKDGEHPLRALVRQVADAKTAKTIRLADDRRLWCTTVRDPASAVAAERRILDNPDNELDGYVDAHVNRVLARPLTRVFLRLGVSPNAVTAISIGIGLLSALCFAIGGYAAGLAGALLLQLAAVVDCCDGDVARATFSESEFGARLDIMGDNVVHMAVFGGIAWGLFAAQAPGARTWLPLGLGAAAIVGTALSVLLVRRVQRLLGESVAADSTRARRSRFVLKNVASRDFTVVVLLCAVLDALDWFLLFGAIGVTIFWIAMAWFARPSVTARA